MVATQEYQQGQEAYLAGRDADANPYPPEGGTSDKRYHWFRGWYGEKHLTTLGIGHDEMANEPKATGPKKKTLPKPFRRGECKNCGAGVVGVVRNGQWCFECHACGRSEP